MAMAFIRSFLLTLILLATCFSQSNKTFVIQEISDFDQVEALINDSVTDNVRILIEHGDYTLIDTFHINRSNVELVGIDNPTLRLAARTNKATIAIGTQRETPQHSDKIKNVSILGITIDGNKDTQTSEYDRDRPWIRNNGIDVRATERLLINNVVSNNNRSGGLVISWGCEDVLVSNSRFSGNFFDGIAYYDSKNVFTVSCQMSENLGAGISLDNRFQNSFFAGCIISDNRDVGIFVRNSKELLFDNCQISNSGNWGAFLSHDERQHGVENIYFNDSILSKNVGGIYLGSVDQSQSNGVYVFETKFDSNRHRPNIETAGVPIKELHTSTASENIRNLGIRSIEQVATIFSQRSATLKQTLN